MLKAFVAFLLLSLMSEGAFYRTQLSDLKQEGEQVDLSKQMQSQIWRSGGIWTPRSLPISRFREFSLMVASLDPEEMSKGPLSVGEVWLVIDLDDAKEVKGFMGVLRGSPKTDSPKPKFVENKVSF